jgi:hypothetical protein
MLGKALDGLPIKIIQSTASNAYWPNPRHGVTACIYSEVTIGAS